MAWVASIFLDNIFLNRVPFPQLSLIYKLNPRNQITLFLIQRYTFDPQAQTTNWNTVFSLNNKVFKTQYSETFQYLLNLIKEAHYQEWETTTTAKGKGKASE